MSPRTNPSEADRTPADQAGRDAAQRDLDTSIFLQAGAGTGKTSVLVGRVIEAVRSGRAELREFVAITCTEKAAGELRDRVRRSLYRALGGADAAETRPGTPAACGLKPLVLTEVRNVRYSNMVRPGESLRVEVTLRKQDEGGWDLEGVGSVNNQTAVQGRFRLEPLTTGD